MSLPKCPRDPLARTKLVIDMLTGERPNDKEQALSALRGDPAPELPTGHAKAAKARVASQTAARRSEIARKAAAARWGAAS